MNVLSLFDGMSCGQIALERSGFKVDNYYASEIDRYAIKVAKANYPNMVHLGDVRGVTREMFQKDWPIDLLLGGSPCQGFSFAGKQLNFNDPRSALFFEFVRVLREFKPKWFLLENVRMKKEFQDIISEHLGVKPIKINSNLVSAQNRERLYWTNIPVNSMPEDKRIYLKDILEDPSEIGPEHYHSLKAIEYMEQGNEKWGQAGDRRADNYEQTPETQKSFTLTANMHKGVPYNYFKDTRSGLMMVGEALELQHYNNSQIKRVYHPDGKAPTVLVNQGGHRELKVFVEPMNWRKLTPLECERLQTVPDYYTNHVSNTQRYKMLGNGWTVDVICHLLKGMKS